MKNMAMPFDLPLLISERGAHKRTPQLQGRLSPWRTLITA